MDQYRNHVDLSSSGGQADAVALKRVGLVGISLALLSLWTVVCLLPGCAFHRKLQSVFGGYGLPDEVDTLPETARAAAALSAGQPRPLWQGRLDASEVDVLAFLAPDRLLVGTLGLSNRKQVKFAYKYSGQDLMLIDSATGTQLWRTQRDSDRYPQTLVASVPTIVLRHDEVGFANEKRKSWFEAFDPQNGRQIWSYKALSPVGFAADPESGLAVVGSWDARAYRVTGLDLRTGREAWTTNLGNFYSTDPQPKLLVIGGAVLLVGEKLVMISPWDGRVLTQAPIPCAWGRDTAVFQTGLGLLLSGGDGVALVDLRTGAAFWKAQTTGSVRLLAPTEPQVFAVVAVGEQEEVEAFDARSGRKLWSFGPVPTLQSALLTTPGALYFTGRNRLTALNPITGTEIFSAALPDTIHSPGDLPDVLAERDGKIIVATEGGVAAFSADQGRPIFARLVSGGQSLSYSYLSNRRNELLQTRALLSDADHRPQTVLAPGPVMSLPDYAAMARANQARVYSNTESVLRSGSGASWMERRGALNQRQIAAQNTAIAERIQVENQVVQATVALAMSMAAGALTMQILAMEALHDLDLKRMGAEVANASWNHLNSIQGRYYVRPFFADGWRLALVDLTDGRRFDLLLSPPNQGLVSLQVASLPAYVLDPSGTRLVARGLGLDASSYRGFQLEQANDMSDKSHMRTVPFASLMTFDTNRFAFLPAQDPPPATKRDPSPAEAALIAGAFYNDPRAIEWALAQGARIETRDGFGRTALIRAVQRNNLDAVQTLLRYGADTYARDGDGLQAWEYNEWVNQQCNFFLNGPSDEKSKYKKIRALLMEEHQKRSKPQ